METTFLLANNDAEQAVIGAIFLNPDMYQELTVKPNYFFDTRHRVIVTALEELANIGTPISLISVAEHLGSRIENAGGISYLTQLSQSMPTTANFIHYQAIISQHYEKRQQIALLERMLRETLEGEPGDVRDDLRTALHQLDELGDYDNDDGHVSKIMQNLYQDMQEPKNEITGAESGFRDLDKMTSGFQKGDLIIVGARPSVGKTALAMNVAQNYALAAKGGTGGPVGVFSLEMPSNRLGERIVSSTTNIDGQVLKNPQQNFEVADWNKVALSMAELSDSPLHIWDKPGVNIAYIRKKCRQLAKLYPGQHIVAIIDYLQLIMGDPKFGGNRQQEVSEISRQLKQIAREFEMSIIALSQLSRKVEERQDKRPTLSDLRESGSIEQDADLIILLYRDDYYDRESESKNMIDLIIAKQRNGPTGLVTLAFKKEFSKFINIEWGNKTV